MSYYPAFPEDTLEFKVFKVEHGYVGGANCVVDRKEALKLATLHWTWRNWKVYLKELGYKVKLVERIKK